MISKEPIPRIGLVGLGNAGSSMLRALSVHSSVRVFDRDPNRFAPLEQVCKHAPVVASNPAEMAQSVDTIIFSLPTPAASLAVAEEIRPHLRPGMTIVESSTVGPDDVEALHLLLSDMKARVIDAPLIGGVHKLAIGQAVFLIGATEEAAGPTGAVLKRIAEEVFFLGERGSGMRTKLIVNAVAHATYVVLMEAGALAAAQGVPLAVLQRLLERESGLLRPLTHRFGERLATHDFAGGMSTANALKDSALILDTARALGVPLFATSAAHSVYELAAREGLAKLDYASIGTLWEQWLDISFAQDSVPPGEPDVAPAHKPASG